MSDFTVPGPGGPGKTYPPLGVFPDCCQPEHLAAIGSPVWYSTQKGKHHTLLTGISVPNIPSPTRSAWSPFLPALPIAGWHRPPCGNGGGDMICLFSKPFCTTLLTQWVSESLATEHTGVSAHKVQHCPEPHLTGQGQGTHCLL